MFLGNFVMWLMEFYSFGALKRFGLTQKINGYLDYYQQVICDWQAQKTTPQLPRSPNSSKILPKSTLCFLI